jgi:hypothetical protein
MILRRGKILAQMVAGKSNAWIARNYGHGRSLICEIRPALDTEPSRLFVLHHAIGAPKRHSRSDCANRRTHLREPHNAISCYHTSPSAYVGHAETLSEHC